MVSYILAIVVGLIFIVCDQLTKYIVATNMNPGDVIKFIPGFMDFFYVRNGGGAWGFLDGYTWILLSVTVVTMIICVALLLKYGLNNKTLFWAITLILSGGIGNLIDRVFRGGSVVDFLHLKFIDFPVFNVADCAVVLGACLLILYFLIDMFNERKERKLRKEELE